MSRRHGWIAAALLGASLSALAGEVPPPVHLGEDGRLVYEADEQGNRVPDFSFAGYRGGGVPLPVVPARVKVAPVDGDNTSRIQAAIDHVSSLPPDDTGFRGAVLLEEGHFEVAGQIRITTSGVVLRGSGNRDTTLVATGTGRRTLIEVRGKPERTWGDNRQITDRYAPVGTRTLHLARSDGLKPGDPVAIQRPSPAEWIADLGMNDSPGRTPYRWKPATLDLRWERVVVAVDGNEVTFDAPLTTALESHFGGAIASPCLASGRIHEVGIENLRCDSEFDATRPRDEEHAWIAIAFEMIENGWIRDLTAEHFVSSLVSLGDGCRTITVQDCVSRSPVSELAGHRRQAFHTRGQLTLFQRCLSDRGRNDFTAGPLTTGPNVFLDCKAESPQGFSGSTGSWASGLLFDNVAIDGGELRLDNLENWNQGTGWNAANSMLWQCSASRIVCRTPHGAANWAIGCWGQFVGNGTWSRLSEFVQPVSLYRAQLAERLGGKSLAALAKNPAPYPEEDAVEFLPTAPTFPNKANDNALKLENGWLTANGRLLVGQQIETAWWRGHRLPGPAAELGPAITRFAPGRTGLGFTDDLDVLTDRMLTANQVGFRHHWGLWYDRRSDDHERVRRPDADVWAPFFEQPWARSGEPSKGEAWDRLTRYDLTRFNPWYFGRLREFAGLARRKGLVLVDEMYFQHNVLEAGAHWASFPWRPANNANTTGLPEPPPYRNGDGSAPSVPGRAKRVFMADAFYDISQPVRCELHRAYIRQCLANLTDEPNVIHAIGAEFTGPLEFARFWLDTVIDWQNEKERDPLIALSTPKDVQDAILDDETRQRAIDVIDLKYWWQTDKGLFAPPGGQSLAPRQSERRWKGGRPTDEDLARMTSDYRRRFPDKVIICDFPEAGWAFLAAGGSLANLPGTTCPELLKAVPRMQAIDCGRKDVWLLGEPGVGYLLCSNGAESVTLDLSRDTGEFLLFEIGLDDGCPGKSLQHVTAGTRVTLSLPATNKCVRWLCREGAAPPKP